MPDEIERVEGAVEGTNLNAPDKEERKIAKKAFEMFVIDRNTVLGSNDLSEAIGAVTLFRNRRTAFGMHYFQSGAELSGAVSAYFESLRILAENGSRLVPDIESLAAFLGTDRTTLMSWRRGDANPDFVPVLNLAWNEIASIKKKLMMENKIPSLPYMQDMQNNHGYVQNVTKTDVNVQVRQQTTSIKQLIDDVKLLP